MCEYKSFVLTPDLGVHWCERDDHHIILGRMGIKDDSQFNKGYMYLEVLEGKMKNYQLDDPPDELPSWYADHEREYKNKVKRLLKPINAIKAKRKLLDDDCEAKRKSLDDDYWAKRKPLDDDYEAKRKSLDYDYWAKRKPLDDDYWAKRKSLDDDYEAKRKPLDDDYWAKRKPLDDELATIEGFVREA